jgi:hypothetical protein
MYLDELLNWLMTVVDTMALEEVYKNGAYRAALEHVAGCFMVSSVVHSLSLCLRYGHRTSCSEGTYRPSTRMEFQISLSMSISSSRGLRD